MRISLIPKSLPLIAALSAPMFGVGCAKNEASQVQLATKVSPLVKQDISPRSTVESPITQDELMKDLIFLASDNLRGRQAGEGILEREVTEYIEKIFREAGLKELLENGKSYRQPMIIDWVNSNKKTDVKPRVINDINKPRQKSLLKPGKEARLFSPTKLPAEGVSTDAIMTHNLVALIEGLDSKLKDQYIIVCAHIDHVGTDKLAKPGEDYIYNGADDNASGASVVLTIGRKIAKAKKEGQGPKRSVIILLTTAEEMGLLGAQFFVENPPVPLNKINAIINHDMVGIGRMGRSSISVLDSDSNGKPNFLHRIHDEIAKETGIERIDHDIEMGRRRSDQAPFADRGIPFLLIFEGLESGNLHKDYHGVGDEASKIDFAKLQRVANFSYRCAMKIANQDN